MDSQEGCGSALVALSPCPMLRMHSWHWYHWDSELNHLSPLVYSHHFPPPSLWHLLVLLLNALVISGISEWIHTLCDLSRLAFFHSFCFLELTQVTKRVRHFFVPFYDVRIFHGIAVLQLVWSFVHWRASRWFPILTLSNKSAVTIDFYEKIRFHFSGINSQMYDCWVMWHWNV